MNNLSTTNPAGAGPMFRLTVGASRGCAPTLHLVFLLLSFDISLRWEYVLSKYRDINILIFKDVKYEFIRLEVQLSFSTICVMLKACEENDEQLLDTTDEDPEGTCKA